MISFSLPFSIRAMLTKMDGGPFSPSTVPVPIQLSPDGCQSYDSECKHQDLCQSMPLLKRLEAQVGIHPHLAFNAQVDRGPQGRSNTVFLNLGNMKVCGPQLPGFGGVEVHPFYMAASCPSRVHELMTELLQWDG